jgi:hypothetical protein
MGAILLVLWLNAGGEPRVAYSQEFATIEACRFAAAALEQEQARLSRVNPNGPQFGPVVSAVCVGRGSTLSR